MSRSHVYGDHRPVLGIWEVTERGRLLGYVRGRGRSEALREAHEQFGRGRFGLTRCGLVFTRQKQEVEA